MRRPAPRLRQLVGSAVHGDEDAPKPRSAGAGVPARDPTGPQSPRDTAASCRAPVAATDACSPAEAQLDALLGAGPVADPHGGDRHRRHVRDSVPAADLSQFAAAAAATWHLTSYSAVSPRLRSAASTSSRAPFA